jgi:NAD(P)H-hydrate epimerase
MSPNVTLPTRNKESHKGDFGRVLMIGGSRGMAGAIAMSGIAALRSGSGLLKIATPDSIQESVASFSPCLMTVGIESKKGHFSSGAIDQLLEEAEWADVIAIGPGMGRFKSQQKLVETLYTELPQPLIVDADALNLLADSDAALAEHKGLRMLTPHPGEFQRLQECKTTDRETMADMALEMAFEAQVTVVLKGARTLVTDGKDRFINRTGNPGMATAGSGDVLTGVIASLVGQGLEPFEASRLGVHLHGLAGDIAADSVGQTSLIATDLIEFLPAALKQYQASP